MGYLVLAAWVIQATMGVPLLVSWFRHAQGRSAALVFTHVIAMIAFLAPWTAFILTGSVLWAWVGFAVLTAFIGFGDATMVRRARRLKGWDRGWGDYFPSIGVALSGAFGRRVTFHMLFSAVVFFGCLAVCIVASVA